MAQLLIRDLEDEVVDRLKDRAERNCRSLEAELRLILAEAVRIPARDPLAVVERIQAMFAGRRFSDSADLIREDRGR